MQWLRKTASLPLSIFSFIFLCCCVRAWGLSKTQTKTKTFFPQKMREVPSLISLCIHSLKKELIHGINLFLLLLLIHYHALISFFFSLILLSMLFQTFRRWSCTGCLRASTRVIWYLSFKFASVGLAKRANTNVCSLDSPNFSPTLFFFFN